MNELDNNIMLILCGLQRYIEIKKDAIKHLYWSDCRSYLQLISFDD